MYFADALGLMGNSSATICQWKGASVVGGIVDRAHAALNAGCDVVLICNDHAKADELLSGLAATTPASCRTWHGVWIPCAKSREAQCADARNVLARAGLAA